MKIGSAIIANATAANPNGAIAYTYDAVGNRLSRTSTVAGVPTVASQSVDANDRLTTDGYDANGNTTSSTGNGYVYDFENRLVKVNAGTANEISIVYDGDGNRVSKTVAGVTTKFLVDTNNLTGYAQVVEELQGSNVTRQYSYGHDLLSQRQSIAGNWTTSFYQYDGHGSVRGLTDTSGAITDTFTYDAFGVLINRTGTTPNLYLYAGEQYDPDLGLYYNRARYLNSGTGRFWSQDSYEGMASDPASLHKYLYANSDPVNGIDPSGNSAITANEAFGVAGIVSQLSWQTLSNALIGIVIGSGVSYLGYKYLTKRWRLSLGFTLEDGLHSFIYARDSHKDDGSGWSYDVYANTTIVRADGNFFGTFGKSRGKIIKQRAGKPDGLTVPLLGRMNDLELTTWEIIVLGESRGADSPVSVEYGYAMITNNCFTWSAYAAIMARVFSLSPF